MTVFRVSVGAAHRLDDIYVYTRERWGEIQAERYIRGLFERFDDIARRRVPWRAIPANSAAKASSVDTNDTSSIGIRWRMTPWAS